MKKVFIIAFFVFFGITQTQAQVTFRPGLRGGANFAHFTQGTGSNFSSGYYDNNGNYINVNYKDEYYTSKTDFYLGFYGALHLTKYYTLQPEINYSRQGSKYEITNSNNVKSTGQIDVNYISISVINKFTFNEKFYFLAGPTFDVIVDKARSVNTNSDVDLAITGGFGFDFTKNFGIEARIKKGIVPVIYNNNSDHTNVVFQLGATYTFDVK